MSNHEFDQSLEAEGIPEIDDPPPRRDIEMNEEAIMVPRDYPIAAGDDPAYAVTAAEDRTQETIAERAEREEPDFAEAELENEAPLGGQLIAPDSSVDSPDLTPEEVALLSEGNAAGLSAEEAAVHVGSEDIADDVDPAAEAAGYIEDR